MINIQSFINDYYKKDDIFYIGFKDRINDKWYHKPFTLDTINFKSLQGQNYYKKDIYLSLNTFEDKDKGRFEHNVKKANKIFFDIDTNGEKIKNEILKDLGPAAYEIHTSKEKFQLIYILEDTLTKEQVKYLTYNLTYYYDTDKTFDLSRVFRAPFYINNKNGFSVKIKKTKTLINSKTLYDFLKLNKWEWITPGTKITKTKTGKTIKTISIIDKDFSKIYVRKFNKDNKYYKQYLKHLDKCDQDNSRADLMFVRFLMYRKLPFEISINFLFQSREDLLIKHSNEINHYINNLKNATRGIK